MDLEEFVRSALVQITQGVEGAQATLKKAGGCGLINPDLQDGTRAKAAVEFDIAVTAVEGTTGTAGGGIRVLSLLTASGGVANETRAESVSRVRFSIPVALPPDPPR